MPGVGCAGGQSSVSLHMLNHHAPKYGHCPIPVSRVLQQRCLKTARTTCASSRRIVRILRFTSVVNFDVAMSLHEGSLPTGAVPPECAATRSLQHATEDSVGNVRMQYLPLEARSRTVKKQSTKHGETTGTSLQTTVSDFEVSKMLGAATSAYYQATEDLLRAGRVAVDVRIYDAHDVAGLQCRCLLSIMSGA
eukprot:2364532-Amphidinium_carterae.1